MTQAIEGALIQIATVVRGVTGIKAAPTNPNETQNEFPFAVTYVSSGNVSGGAIGTTKSLNNIAVDVLTNRMDLQNDLAILIPFLDTVPAALNAEIEGNGDRFSNTISTFDRITYQLLPQVDYAGAQMIGYRFVMENVKILWST